MIKRVVLVCSLLMIGLAANAAEQTMRVGIQAGPTFSQASTTANPALNTDRRLGFAVGGNFEYKFDDAFSIQPELMYIQKGAEVALTGGNSLHVKRDYIDIPVLAKATLDAGGFKPFIFTGPVVSIKASSEATLVPSNRPIATTLDNTKSADFGWTFGGGFDIQIVDNVSMFVSGRYNFGFIDVVDDPNVSWKNRGALIMAGAQFGI